MSGVVSFFGRYNALFRESSIMRFGFRSAFLRFAIIGSASVFGTSLLRHGSDNGHDGATNLVHSVGVRSVDLFRRAVICRVGEVAMVSKAYGRLVRAPKIFIVCGALSLGRRTSMIVRGVKSVLVVFRASLLPRG